MMEERDVAEIARVFGSVDELKATIVTLLSLCAQGKHEEMGVYMAMLTHEQMVGVIGGLTQIVIQSRKRELAWLKLLEEHDAPPNDQG